MFIKDRTGQTLFFLLGPRFAGYLVPDAQCERALRDAAARYGSMQNSLAYFTVPLGTISIFKLDSPAELHEITTARGARSRPTRNDKRSWPWSVSR